MASKITTNKFQNLGQVRLFLNGGLILGGVVPPEGLPLVGKQLRFTQPTATTVTFVARSDGNVLLQFSDIQSQIETAVAAVQVGQIDGMISIVEADPVHGTALTTPTDPTLDARPLLGSSAGADSIGLVVNPPHGAAPALLAAYPDDGTHILYTSFSQAEYGDVPLPLSGDANKVLAATGAGTYSWLAPTITTTAPLNGGGALLPAGLTLGIDVNPYTWASGTTGCFIVNRLLYQATTDATKTTILTYTPGANSVGTWQVDITARNTTNGDGWNGAISSAVFHTITGTITAEGTVPAIVPAPARVSNTLDAISATVEISGATIIVTVTGGAGLNIHWLAQISYSEVV